MTPDTPPISTSLDPSTPTSGFFRVAGSWCLSPALLVPLLLLLAVGLEVGAAANLYAKGVGMCGVIAWKGKEIVAVV